MQVCEFLWTHQWKYLTRLCRKDKRMDAHLNPELTNCQSLIIPGICFMRRCPLCSSLTAPNLLAPKAHWVGALNSIKLPHYVRMDWMDTSARLQPLACTLSPTYHAVINLAMLEKVFCCQNTYLILKVMVGGGGGGGGTKITASSTSLLLPASKQQAQPSGLFLAYNYMQVFIKYMAYGCCDNQMTPSEPQNNIVEVVLFLQGRVPLLL